MSRTLGAGAIVAVAAFVAYLKTLCPTIAAGDSGELAAAAATLGIAHPPGFPLWTVAGRVVTLAGGANPAAALNVFSAACTAAAAGLVTIALSSFGGRPIAAAGIGLAFAWSRAVWGTAVVTEVYALNLLMTVATLAAALAARCGSPRWFALAAYLAGLGAGNHPFALLAVPAVVWAAAWPGPGAAGTGRMPGMVLAFLLGLSVYSYLPVRLAEGPEINWGGMRSAADVVDHVLRTQYGGLGEASARTSAALRLGVFAEVAARSVPGPLLLLALAGVVLLCRRVDRGLALVLPVFVLFAGPATAIAIRYEDTFLDRSVVTPFFLPAVLGLFLAAGAALAAIEDVLRRRLAARVARLTAVTLAVLPPLFLLEMNRAACDRSGSTVAADYGVRLLESLPEGSRLYLDGDNALFSVLYLQRIQGVRPDVQVADRTLNLLVAAYGDDFPAMSRIERRDAAPGREVSLAFAEKDRPTFYAEEIDLTAFGGARLVPSGYVQQLIRPGETPVASAHRPGPIPRADPEDYMECHLAGVGLYREATWLAYSGRPDDARERYRQGADIAWRIPGIVRNCGIGFLELGDYAEAERLFLRTLEMEPANQDALYDLALLYMMTGRTGESLSCWARLDSLDTGFAEVPLNYATALLQAGKLEEAGAQARKALRLAPDLAPAREIEEAVRRGLEIGGEEGVFEARRAVGPLTVDGTLQLARRYLDRGDWERATELFREAANRDPKEPGAAYGLGYGLLRVGRYGEAADAFRRLLALDAKSAVARNALAYVLAETGDSLVVAERLAREAVALDSTLAPYAKDTLGWVRHRAGRHAEALASLREAEATLPADDLSMRAENHYHLGKVMLALGRRDEAREYFRLSAERAAKETWVADLRARRKDLGDGGTT